MESPGRGPWSDPPRAFTPSAPASLIILTGPMKSTRKAENKAIPGGTIRPQGGGRPGPRLTAALRWAQPVGRGWMAEPSAACPASARGRLRLVDGCVGRGRPAPFGAQPSKPRPARRMVTWIWIDWTAKPANPCRMPSGISISPRGRRTRSSCGPSTASSPGSPRGSLRQSSRRGVRWLDCCAGAWRSCANAATSSARPTRRPPSCTSSSTRRSRPTSASIAICCSTRPKRRCSNRSSWAGCARPCWRWAARGTSASGSWPGPCAGSTTSSATVRWPSCARPKRCSPTSTSG